MKTTRTAMALLLTLCATALAGVILNPLGSLGEAEPGWAGSLEGSIRSSGGNTDIRSRQAEAALHWQGEKNRWKFLGSLSQTESGGVRSSEFQVAHLRHNLELSDRLHSLLFTQVQRNPFQLLESRWLLGAGARWTLQKSEKSDAFLGASSMLEREKVGSLEQAELSHRLSLFLKLGLQAGKGVRWSLTGFYQPLWSDPEDARATLSSALRIDLGKSLFLRLSADIDYDSRPPENVEAQDWTTKSSLGFRF
ncbi:MAG: DUF481 domain-containing protein [Candidatus Krumholzibacteria bacterium]|jgi:putative salt-induced outer membrane protein YdiY|nr:DUF481 domain-containing protein [Candidatus Krumholzibacteria bacterium]